LKHSTSANGVPKAERPIKARGIAGSMVRPTCLGDPQAINAG
jgi:hypothetical protein